MTTHSQKKLDETALLEYRNRFNLPLGDAEATTLAFYKPTADSPELRYLHERQRGRLSAALRHRAAAVAVPPISSYAQFALAADGKEMSTTMAFILRMLGNLLKDNQFGPRVVPIVADEAHLWHGQSVQAGGHLLKRWPALCAGGHRIGAVPPRST